MVHSAQIDRRHARGYGHRKAYAGVGGNLLLENQIAQQDAPVCREAVSATVRLCFKHPQASACIQAKLSDRSPKEGQRATFQGIYSLLAKPELQQVRFIDRNILSCRN